MPTINPGDIIFADRTAYKHYGVYVDKMTVIHYATDDDSFDSEKAYVHRTTPKNFAKGDTVYRLNFHDNPAEWESTMENLRDVDAEQVNLFNTSSIMPSSGGIGDFLRDIYAVGNLIFGKDDDNPRLYSPQETIKRAESRLGERDYSLLFDNCEHFALWCKTGLSRSTQIEAYIDIVDEFEKVMIVR